MASSDLRFYRLDLTNAPTGFDLIISVLPETESNAPEVFVSHHEEFPRNVIDADYPSASMTGNMVFVNNKDLQQPSNPLYIGLRCAKLRCQAQLLVEWKIDQLKVNHSRIFSDEAQKLLSPNTPFYGVLKQGKPHYFEALLLASDSSVIISGQSDSGNIDLYISTDPNNKYPNQDSYTYTTKTSITLTPKDREKACGTSKSLSCSVYITVMSTGDQEETLYLLSIRRDSAPEQANPAIALENGREIQANIPVNTHLPVVFYYNVGPSQHSIVTVRCPGREMIIYARRVKVDLGSFAMKPDIAAVDEDTAEISSLEDENIRAGVASVSVPPLADSNMTIVV